MLPIKTILHPTDFSSQAADAFAAATSLARDYGAKLILLHVVGPPTFVDGASLVAFDPSIYEDQLRQDLAQLAARAPGVCIEERLVQGIAVTEILKTAAETRCDVIVMGTHGRSGLRHLLMGSIAEAVVRQAPCPVLTVRAALRQSPPEEVPVPAEK
jgi:nucleotide-binding universal stress UspA family protein